MVPPHISTPTSTPNLMGCYAGFISRFFAEVIDTFIISITFISMTWFVSVTTTMLQLRTFFGYSINNIPGSQSFIDQIFGPAGAGLLTGVYIITYHVFFWVLIGQTPGKVLIGLRIITLKGGRLTFGRALLRMIGFFVSAIPLYLGFFWILADDRRQAWHDKIAGTFVVYTWAARPDERFLVDEIEHLELYQSEIPKER